MQLTFLKSISFLCLLLWVNILVGQLAKPIQFNNIQKTEGLPNNTVNKIIKDKFGFLWIATNDGLCRYDGPNQMTVFRADTSQNKNTLKSSNIRTLYADSKGNLWIGTRLGGLTRYHQATDTWTTFKYQKNDKKSISNNEILTITEDSQHRLWIGTENGLNLYNDETETFTRFLVDSNDSYSLKSKAVLTITEDDKGWIWVGTWAGGIHLLLVDKTGNITDEKFRNILPSNDKSASNIWVIYQDPQQRYWVGTHGSGLFLMHLPDDASNQVNQQQWHPKFHNYQESEQDNFSLSSNAVQDILMDSKGKLWIATGHGLSIIKNTKFNNFTATSPDFKFHNYYFDVDESTSLAANNIMAILEDEQGLVWLATNTGVSQYNSYTSQFDIFNIFGQTYKTPNAQNLFIDDQQIAWIGTGKDGVIQYNLENQTIHSFSNQYANLFIDTYVSCIVTPDKEWLYVGSKLGVSVINMRTLVAKKFPTPAWLRKNIKNFYVQEIFVDKNETIWIGTEVGLFSINQQNGKYTNYERIEGDATSISDNSINSILDDEEGNLWIATYNGLNKAKTNKEGKLVFERFLYDESTENSIISNRITALKKINNQLFIGTTAGLCSYDLNRKQFKDHSSSGHKYWIQSIVDADDDNIWTSTTEGIFHFDIKNNFFNVFEKKDGLGDLAFRLGACAKDEKNYIYFGSRKGITRFHPDKIVTNKQVPPVYITSLKKINPKEEFTFNGITKKAITLYHNDYLLSINFAALNYNRGEKNQYIYQLEGFEDSWRTSKFGIPIVYTNLAPKTYTFKVKAANNDGVWNEEGVTMKIIKQPAFWQTWWFYLSVFTGLVLLIGTGFKWYTQNIRNRNLILKSYNDKLNKEIEERKHFEQKLSEFNEELKRSNRDLEQFAYIASHDLKEPLRIIGNFSGLLARAYKTKLDQDAFQYIHFIEDGVKRMSNLINSLLTYSRVGRKEMKFQTIDLNKLVETKLFDLSQVIKERNAKVTVDTLPAIYGEPEQVGMIFHNLINNAIKFNQQPEPRVFVKVEEAVSKNHWQFSVKDNGIGIDPKYQQKIFEIFRRLHGKREYEGTGIGLSVCQKIVFRHEGKIWLTSTLGVGTTFYFTIRKNLITKKSIEENSAEKLMLTSL